MNSQRPLSEPILNNFLTDGVFFFFFLIFKSSAVMSGFANFAALTQPYLYGRSMPQVFRRCFDERKAMFSSWVIIARNRHVDEASLHFRWSRGASGGDEIFRVSHTVRLPSGWEVFFGQKKTAPVNHPNETNIAA